MKQEQIDELVTVIDQHVSKALGHLGNVQVLAQGLRETGGAPDPDILKEMKTRVRDTGDRCASLYMKIAELQRLRHQRATL